MKVKVTFLLPILAVLLTCSPSWAYRSPYHNPPLSPDCERPKENLEILFQWKQIGFYDFPSNSPDFAFDQPNNATFIPYNNVPIGITATEDKLFVTVPRRAPGIPSTLNYIDLKASVANQSPLLKSYPDVETNILDMNAPRNPDRLISVYRPRVDYVCNRLWFIDTGILEYGERVQVQPASLWVIDLATGRRIQRFEIPASAVPRANGLISLTVDAEADKCDAAFVYFPDMFNYRLNVYSLAENRMWTFNHNYFYLDPLYGDYNIGGQKFQWKDGVFSVTLGPYMMDGSREAYFHAMSSINEYMVSTRVLKNATAAARGYHGEDFKFLGKRQEFGQSNMHAFDETTGIVFYGEINRNSVGCWNSGETFSADNHDVVMRNDVQMVYPSDLTVDNKGYVYVLSNRIPVFVYSRLNVDDYNFRIWKGKGKEIVKGTKCE